MTIGRSPPSHIVILCSYSCIFTLVLHALLCRSADCGHRLSPVILAVRFTCSELCGDGSDSKHWLRCWHAGPALSVAAQGVLANFRSQYEAVFRIEVTPISRESSVIFPPQASEPPAERLATMRRLHAGAMSSSRATAAAQPVWPAGSIFKFAAVAPTARPLVVVPPAASTVLSLRKTFDGGRRGRWLESLWIVRRPPTRLLAGPRSETLQPHLPDPRALVISVPRRVDCCCRFASELRCCAVPLPFPSYPHHVLPLLKGGLSRILHCFTLH